MSLQSILKSKDKFTQDVLKAFNSEWDNLVPNVQKAITSLFKRGEYSVEALEAVFTNSGFADLANETASQFNKAIKYSEQLSKELGYKFLLTEENIVLFDELNQLTLDTLVGTGRASVIDLKRFAIESQIEGRTVGQIAKGFEQIFENSGRRLNTEIYTGLRNYESAVDLTSMTNAGIEKFVYIGPNDQVTRDRCEGTLNDPRQSTGWTYNEVQNSETPFIEVGGWNCRHRWVAFV